MTGTPAGPDPGARDRPVAQVPSRLLSGGVDFCDYIRLSERTEAGAAEDWVAVCTELADEAARHADAQLALGHRLTARRFYRNAEALYRVGQYGITELTAEKLHLYRRLTDCFASAARLAEPPFEEVNIAYRGFKMHGWIQLPATLRPRNPVVIVIPGATGFKEETAAEAQLMVDRGLAVLNIDGPGQGVTCYFNGGHLQVDVEDAYRAMADHLEADGRFGRIAISGRSTGGYYVARAAATDPRLAACVVNGGSYAPAEILAVRPWYLRKFAILFGTDDDTAAALLDEMTLNGLAARIHCPLLIVHGADDPIFSVAGVQRLHDEARSTDKELRIYEGAGHCANGRETEAYNGMADWLADRLLQAGG
jgi:dipeptidyl aminopeptidase/acylaminoacyl peptidase